MGSVGSRGNGSAKAALLEATQIDLAFVATAEQRNKLEDSHPYVVGYIEPCLHYSMRALVTIAS